MYRSAVGGLRQEMAKNREDNDARTANRDSVNTRRTTTDRRLAFLPILQMRGHMETGRASRQGGRGGGEEEERSAAGEMPHDHHEAQVAITWL